MPATPYRAITWNPNELISEDKMDQLANNDQWLLENTPRALYLHANGVKRVENVKIAAGRVVVTRRKAGSAAVNVNFANFFTAGCAPLITTGIVAEGAIRLFVVVNGLGQFHPDHRGFQAYVATAKGGITRTFWVAWQAVGY